MWTIYMEHDDKISVARTLEYICLSIGFSDSDCCSGLGHPVAESIRFGNSSTSGRTMIPVCVRISATGTWESLPIYTLIILSRCHSMGGKLFFI